MPAGIGIGWMDSLHTPVEPNDEIVEVKDDIFTYVTMEEEAESMKRLKKLILMLLTF